MTDRPSPPSGPTPPFWFRALRIMLEPFARRWPYSSVGVLHRRLRALEPEPARPRTPVFTGALALPFTWFCVLLSCALLVWLATRWRTPSPPPEPRAFASGLVLAPVTIGTLLRSAG